MSATATTLSAALGVDDPTARFTSITGMLRGMYVRVDGEVLEVLEDASSASIPVKVARGVEGTFNQAHPVSAKAIYGVGSDFPSNSPGIDEPTPFPPQMTLPVYSYSASGALLAAQGIHYLNGTSVLAMTVAAPTTLQDGQVMYIASNGAAAHTVTFTGGLSGAGSSYDVLTVNATAPVLMGPFMAVNGLWQAAVSVPMAGTVTNVTASLA